MDEIDKAVVGQLKQQKGHEEVLALWKQIWGAYQEDGAAGVDDLIADLLRYPGDDDAEEEE